MTGVQPGPRVALVGLGRVGMDAPTVKSADGFDVIRNHLDAIQIAGGRISALVDPSSARRDLARQRCPAHGPLAEGAGPADLQAGIADIVTIATPAAGRLDTLQRALALRPRAIVMEKPLAEDAAAGRALVDAAAAAGTPLFMAFNRRTDPGMRAFREAFDPAAARRAVFYYGKGLFNYASHAVDSILHWFGPVDEVRAVGGPYANPDDECASFSCRTASGLEIDVIGVTGVDYDVFEADIFLPRGRVGFRNNGAEKFRAAAHDNLYYPGYAGLVERQQQPARPIGGFVEMYREVFGVLESGKTSNVLCSGDVALEGLHVLAAVVRSARDGGTPVVPAKAASPAH